MIKNNPYLLTIHHEAFSGSVQAMWHYNSQQYVAIAVYGGKLTIELLERITSLSITSYGENSNCHVERIKYV